MELPPSASRSKSRTIQWLDLYLLEQRRGQAAHIPAQPETLMPCKHMLDKDYCPDKGCVYGHDYLLERRFCYAKERLRYHTDGHDKRKTDKDILGADT